MKYRITVEKKPQASHEKFEQAMLCIVSTLNLIEPPATGAVESASTLIVDIELDTREQVKKALSRLFSDSASEVEFCSIEKAV